MRYTPYGFDKINLNAGTNNPSNVKSYNNKSFAFWERILFQKACSIIEFELPKEWEGSRKDFFYYCLFKFGFLAVWDDKDFGYCFNPGTLSGYDFYYQPTKVLISNPVWNTKNPGNEGLEIGEDVEIIKLTPDFKGIYDVVEYYAEKLSLLDNAINMSLINSKFALMIAAKNKSAAAMVKKMLDKINRGEPAIIFDSSISDDNRGNMPFQIIENNIAANYLTTQQLQDFQTIMNEFDSQIGIPTIPYQKKERMVVSEAESKEIDATSRSVVWFDTLKSSVDIINRHFSNQTPIKVFLRYAVDSNEEGGENNELSENNIDRPRALDE